MRQHGFTLIEMMIVIALIALLAAIALPNYNEYVIKAGRADGKTKLLEIMAAQERFYSQNQTYTATLGAGGLNYPAAANGSVASNEGKYDITAAACAGTAIANCVQLTATPKAGQAGDAACRNLLLDSRGTKAFSGTADPAKVKCW